MNFSSQSSQDSNLQLQAHELTIMVLAGEASSDAHAAALVCDLQKLKPNLFVFGMGGSALRATGAKLIIDSEQHASVMGFTEVLSKVRTLLKAKTSLINAARQYQPDILILVDFPDFNMHMGQTLKQQLGLKVVYYVSPQLWAWRRGRVKKIKKFVDKMIPIFPFEEEFYRAHGVTARYVGHPLLDRPVGLEAGQSTRNQLDLEQERIIALLPGSRKAEIEKLLLPMLEAFALLKAKHSDVVGILPVAPGLNDQWLEKYIPEHLHRSVKLTKLKADRVLQEATVAIVASGTASLEAALAQVPSVVTYRLSSLTYLIAKLLVRGVKHFAMANLVARKKVVPELLQAQVTPANIFAELDPLLADEARRKQVVQSLACVREALLKGVTEGESSTQAAAREVLSLV